MKKLLLVLMILVPRMVAAQKVYVWCPENINVKPRVGLMENDTINVAIFDGRALPKKQKNECTPDQLISALLSQLKSTYPSTTFHLLPETDYNKKNKDEKSVLIKIGISAYQAGFGTDVSVGIRALNGQITSMVFPAGAWNAVTAYSVQVFKGSKNESKEISHLASRSNLYGYSSARKALKESYGESNQELLFFLDKQLSN